MKQKQKRGELAKAAKPQTISEVMTSIIDKNSPIEGYKIALREIKLRVATELLGNEFKDLLFMVGSNFWKTNINANFFSEAQLVKAHQIAAKISNGFPDFEVHIVQINTPLLPPFLALEVDVYYEDEECESDLFTVFVRIE